MVEHNLELGAGPSAKITESGLPLDGVNEDWRHCDREAVALQGVLSVQVGWTYGKILRVISC